jgi:hypothetical protein
VGLGRRFIPWVNCYAGEECAYRRHDGRLVLSKSRAIEPAMVMLEIDTNPAPDRRKLVTARRSARIRRDATSVSRRNSPTPVPRHTVAEVVLRLMALPLGSA